MIEFSIKPRLCVLSGRDELCQDEIEIKWSSDTLRSLCLFQYQKKLPLRCWEDKYEGIHQFVISTAESINFHLKEMHDNQLLVSREFEVMQDNTQYRRRRRSSWSFF